MKLPTIDSLPLCPVFKGAKKTNQQRSGERKGSLSLGPPSVDYPLQLKNIGRCETRGVYAL